MCQNHDIVVRTVRYKHEEYAITSLSRNINTKKVMRMNTISTPIPYTRTEEIRIQEAIVNATPDGTTQKMFEEDRLDHLQKAPHSSSLSEASYKLEDLLGYTSELDNIIREKIEERDAYNNAVLACIQYKYKHENDVVHAFDLKEWLKVEENVQFQQLAGVCVSRRRRPDERLDLAKFMEPHIVERLRQNSIVKLSEPDSPEKVKENLKEFKETAQNEAIRHRINEQFENKNEIEHIVQSLPISSVHTE